MVFDFMAPGRISFGRGRISELGAAAAGMGRRAILVRGMDPGRAAPVVAALESAGVVTAQLSVPGEPGFAWLRAALVEARAFQAELVIGFGGGSAIDAAKALAALLANGGDPLDYAEVIGRGLPLATPSLPCIAVPTTAGTGSEVTRNAVLRSEDRSVKVSLRSATMLPRLALVDPELTLGLPPGVTASTGLDAFTQLLEPFVCNRANPLVDSLCREGLARAVRDLPRAWREGGDLDAREGMAFASLLGGLALANARLGAVHGLAGPLGGLRPAPHGAICAALLPAVVGVNVRALRARDPSSPALDRYAEVATLLRGRAAFAEEAGPAIADFRSIFGVPDLAALGFQLEQMPGLIEKARDSSSMQGNPIVLEDAELAEILACSFGEKLLDHN